MFLSQRKAVSPKVDHRSPQFLTNMRNFLIHGYHNVEEDLVWEAISVDLHLIREKIVKYLEEF